MSNFPQAGLSQDSGPFPTQRFHFLSIFQEVGYHNPSTFIIKIASEPAPNGKVGQFVAEINTLHSHGFDASKGATRAFRQANLTQGASARSLEERVFAHAGDDL